jgi:hypothetical protein
MMRISVLMAFSCVLMACAGLPESMSQLSWQDQRGDRGTQVKQRDLAWCVASVETRRSLLESCMNERGWIAAL